jgi:hypothetical protein
MSYQFTVITVSRGGATDTTLYMAPDLLREIAAKLDEAGPGQCVVLTGTKGNLSFSKDGMAVLLASKQQGKN